MTAMLSIGFSGEAGSARKNRDGSGEGRRVAGRDIQERDIIPRHHVDLRARARARVTACYRGIRGRELRHAVRGSACQPEAMIRRAARAANGSFVL